MTLKKLTPHRRRQLAIERLVNVPKTQKRFFWSREMKLLKDLEARYSLDFLEIVTFPKKYDRYSLGEKSGKDYIHIDNKPKNTKDLFK